MSDNWVVQNLENALETWNDKLSEIWQLLTTTPQNFKGGSIWNVMVTINGAVQAIGLALLVLFFVVGVVRTCGSFTDVKKPEHALKLFVRFAIAKGVITYGLELMLALFNIIQGVISTILTSSGFGTPDQTTLPAEMVTTIEDCGFFESIPLWAVTLIGGLFITVLSFIMIMTVYGRFFKLYMYTAIAPIPLSTFAGEPTQNVGKSFIKSYCAVLLEGAVIVLACIIFSLFASSPPVVNPDAAAVTQVWSYIGELAMFGGGSDSNTYTAVSAEVQAYEPVIQKYAKQYGIPEYVELIKAVMMQESGGRGLDPMQAAEGSFNKKYPHEPNGIKDPEYSIECGVQELKAALTSAEVKSPIDMENIKLALQGYNFGNGYISWARSKYGCYSYANAVEFSTQQAQRLGWSSYGDTQYPAHVLRYYPYGRAFTSGSNQAIVEVALTQLGNEGGQPYWSWYGFQSREEWCACFVSWCADQCGYIESGIIPKFAGCVDGANWFKSRNQWHDRNYEPKAGDIIFFDWGGDGATDHVGIVEKCENGTVYTVEGNSGDACKQRTYAVGSSSIYGYGIPAY